MARLSAVLLALCVVAASRAEAKFFHRMPSGCSAPQARRHMLPHPSLALRRDDSASCRAGCFSQSFSFFRFHDDGSCHCLRACSKAPAGASPNHEERPNSENSVPAPPPPANLVGTYADIPMAPPPASTIQNHKGHGPLEGAKHKLKSKDNEAPQAERRLGISLVLQHVGKLLQAWH